MSRLILTGMVVVASISCGPTAAQQPPAASNLLVSTTELVAHLKDSDLVLLHVADRATVFEQAHIPGARFLSYGEVAVDGPDELGAELPPMDELKRVLGTQAFLMTLASCCTAIPCLPRARSSRWM
jgi:hypothetical protein